MTVQLLTVPEVAERLRISHRSVYRLAKENRLDWLRVQGQLRFPEDAFDAYVEAARVRAVPR